MKKRDIEMATNLYNEYHINVISMTKEIAHTKACECIRISPMKMSPVHPVKF